MDTGNISPGDARITIPSPCNFDDLGNRLSSRPCSPRINDLVTTGLFINGPKEVFLSARPDPETGAHADIPVYVTFSHNLGTVIPLHDNFEDAIVFVAVNAATHKVYSGKYEPLGSPIPPDHPNPNLSPEQMKERTVRGYVNNNLAALVPLPPEPATWYVYVVIGPYHSNMLKIKVGEEE